MDAMHVKAATVGLDEWGARKGADSGEPLTSGLRLHEKGSKPEAGVWACTPGGWAIEDRPNTEVNVILSGRARITNDDGSVIELEPGDLVVLPTGWSGRWDILEPLRKTYAIW
jgi:uncharacterized protein